MAVRICWGREGGMDGEREGGRKMWGSGGKRVVSGRAKSSNTITLQSYANNYIHPYTGSKNASRNVHKKNRTKTTELPWT